MKLTISSDHLRLVIFNLSSSTCHLQLVILSVASASLAQSKDPYILTRPIHHAINSTRAFSANAGISAATATRTEFSSSAPNANLISS
jgi:hypothetical protein